MKKHAKLIALLIGVALFVTAFVWMLTTHGPLAPVSVQSATVVRSDLKSSVFGIGIVDARLSYAISPIVPGRLLRVLVDQGDTVKQGQILAEMDPIDLDRRLQAAQSAESRSVLSVRVADAQVAEAASRAQLAQLNSERDLSLFQQNVISKQVLDNSSQATEAAKAALASARANAAAAKQDTHRTDAESHGVSSLRESLKLLSPADGVIVSREAEPGTTAIAGQAVLRLIVPQSLWVRARVDQSRAKAVQVGQVATIVLRSDPDKPMQGRVARIELQSDAVTEERIVDVSFEPSPSSLYLGELAEVTIQLPGEAAVLTIPSAAIARDGGHTGVWQAENGRVRFKPVRIGRQGEAGVTQVLSGLNEGESFIVYSSAQLTDRARVREKQVGQL